MIPVISFIGNSNSGKTTYLEKLIAEMKRRHYKIAIVKHDVHGFDIDHPGKDTWRHAQAGADIVCISSPQKMALIKKVDQELSLDQVLDHIDNVDFIFTEGYKQEAKPKIEVFRQKDGNRPLGRLNDLIAVVSNGVVYEDIPHFTIEDPKPLADFLEKTFV
ncbi:molybdopterin-guanine dinucleotide biosynthesis protein B [Dendrosporobacter sp. 1207_IL3150]|uniref:molybdopterin-guanine dinucleotide biosynthesis protein B n=1 Tax=Dendrosporobacter sp. 1207_IL3150 TaxID=3084054 RepID=UPI002FD98018